MYKCIHRYRWMDFIDGFISLIILRGNIKSPDLDNFFLLFSGLFFILNFFFFVLHLSLTGITGITVHDTRNLDDC